MYNSGFLRCSKDHSTFLPTGSGHRRKMEEQFEEHLPSQQYFSVAHWLKDEQGSLTQLLRQTLFRRQQCCVPGHEFVDEQFVAATPKDAA